MKNRRIFLVGAPKCGTTSLAHWLGRHTRVQLATSKEPGFFRSGKRRWIVDAHHPDRFEVRDADDYMSDPDAYERQFCGAGSDVWRLDASTDYFADAESSGRIKAVSDDDKVKVLCVLRDPVERMYSEYRHSLRDGAEMLSFRRSLDAEEERIAAGYQPLFFHKDRSRYWTHITRWRAHFGDENFMMLSYSEIGKNPGLERKIFDFLGLGIENIGTIPKLNASGPASKTRRLMTSTKNLIKSALGRRSRQPIVTYPAFTREDQEYAFSAIREEVEPCMADAKIPTGEWTLCSELLSDNPRSNANVPIN